jgi:hypothetical protein
MFDVEIAKPLFFGGRTFGLFPFGSEQTPENNRELEGLENFGGYTGMARGYASAVLFPPYGLQRIEKSDTKVGGLKNEELSGSFVALCDAVFGEVSTLQIWNWPVSCSEYFTPGLYWWGSYFWTVYAPSKNWIVTIIASSTD